MAVGKGALDAATTGDHNTGIGTGTLSDHTTGDGNTAVGRNALGSNTTASNNTAVGKGALVLNTTGQLNVALGRDALRSNTTASNNTALGKDALYANTEGYSNVAVGMNSGVTNVTGVENVYVGHASGGLSTGSSNVFVGQGAGYNSTGSTNTFLGKDAGISMTSGSKNTIVGKYSGNQGSLDLRTSSNYIVISDGDGNPRLYMNENGALFSPYTQDNTTSASANVFISAGQFYRSTSSQRYKNTINDAAHGLADLLKLRSVTYKGNNDGDTIFGGLIAEEVHDAGLTEFVQYDKDDKPDSLAYGNMVSLCIKAIQEQQATITALEARIATLEAK